MQDLFCTSMLIFFLKARKYFHINHIDFHYLGYIYRFRNLIANTINFFKDFN